MAEPTEKPVVMLLSLKGEPHFDTMYSNLLAHLSTNARIKASNSASATLDHLAANQPAAILITDAALVGGAAPRSDAFASVLEKLNGYVRAGGTAIFCCHFASYAPPVDGALDGFFADAFGLPWRRGSYYRTTFALNAAAARHVGQAQQRRRRLAAAYSQKAVHLRDVESAQAVYLPTAESKLESLVFTAESIEDREQTPVAWARVGEGWVGYVGDVNAEEESDEVILAMCGL
ncbi:Transcription factor [Lasiodiplodia theobromae]|uniref:Transcription factor n=1 Tax=Lasiodiplodia theobromae TaxID=45133 RepID=UPI0015C3657C|nr:Transcription factor [Lasiodiplodia theobromae]KAF4544425.1 Transcription factor [Lasiodiplodia theobromae]